MQVCELSKQFVSEFSAVNFRHLQIFSCQFPSSIQSTDAENHLSTIVRTAAVAKAKQTPALVVSYLPRANPPHMPQLAVPPTTHSRRGQYEFVDITCSRSNKLLPQTGNCEASPIDQQQSIPSFPS